MPSIVVNALDVHTTGVIFLDASTTNTFLSIVPGATGTVLTSNGPTVAPSFQAGSGGSGIVTINGDVSFVTGATVIFTGGPSTGLSFTGDGVQTMHLGGTLAVTNGGTGVASFPINGVLTSGATTTSALTAKTLNNGQIIIGSTSAPPIAANITAGTGISITNGANSITIANTSANITWSTQNTSFTASVGNGYLITASCSCLLPPVPIDGSTISFIVALIGVTFSIQGGGGSQIITIGTSNSSVGSGFCTNTTRGDSVTFVYSTTGSRWISLGSPQGTWVLT